MEKGKERVGPENPLKGGEGRRKAKGSEEGTVGEGERAPGEAGQRPTS